MTADEWNVSGDWTGMLDQLRSIDGSRKLRLWAVAICRHILERHAREPISLDRYGAIITSLAPSVAQRLDAAELFADSAITRRELTSGLSLCGGPWNVFHVPLWQSRLVTHLVRHVFANFSDEFRVPTTQELANLLRDIFGNPFRSVEFDPAWRSESAVALARAAYESRNFTPLPILADALEEAGCDHPDVLAHCRGPGPHARGCWVVDAVLGKT